jgi:ribosomal protein S18 acetylase RimI-like enzyme
MEIGPLPESCFADAVALWRAAGLTVPWNDPDEDLRRAMRGPESVVLAALDGGSLLATAMVGHDGHRGWVYYLAVAPPHRGRGLARRMLEACEDWVRNRSIRKIQLMVRDGDAGLVALYEHLGYERSDVAVLGRRLDGLATRGAGGAPGARARSG